MLWIDIQDIQNILNRYSEQENRLHRRFPVWEAQAGQHLCAEFWGHFHKGFSVQWDLCSEVSPLHLWPLLLWHIFPFVAKIWEKKEKPSRTVFVADRESDMTLFWPGCARIMKHFIYTCLLTSHRLMHIFFSTTKLLLPFQSQNIKGMFWNNLSFFGIKDVYKI